MTDNTKNVVIIDEIENISSVLSYNVHFDDLKLSKSYKDKLYKIQKWTNNQNKN